jgi:hypothetical protein
VLDPRLYRAAFAPLLIVVVVAAFALVDRPRPIQTTLAPDAFDGAHALTTLQGLAAAYPIRRPGDPADGRLAAFVARTLHRSFKDVRVRHADGRTIDGKHTLTTVIATRLGQPGPGIVVVAHRDAAGHPAEAELSGTATLLELARVFGGTSTKRTLTLVSTSGGSGGLAGAAHLAGQLPGGARNPDAVIVLGDVASRDGAPSVLPWSTSSALAPVQLRRTAEVAIKAELGVDAATPRALTQLARLAFPFSLGEEGPLNAAGVPAVALEAGGEGGPAPDAAVDPARLRGFGRAAMRMILALDNGPSLTQAPNAEVVIVGKVLPAWVMRLIVGILLLPMLVAAIDGFARVRRRRAPVAPWLRWLVGLALPFAAAVVLARLLGLTGLVADAPGNAVAAGRVPVDGVSLAAVVCIFVLAALVVRPLHRWLAVGPGPDGPGPSAALAVTMTVLALLVWVFNPFAAAVLVLPAHLWLLASVPEVRLPRWASALLVVVALVPAAGVLAVFASATGASVLQLPWLLVLLVAGGGVGPATLAVFCVLGACAVGAWRLSGLPRGEDALAAPATPSVRGPLGYAGPGSLGGTESGFGSTRR